MSLPPEPAPPRNQDQLQTLVDRVLILPDDPLAGYTGWRRRIAGFVWRFLGPSLQRQQEFNGAMAACLTGHVGGDLGEYIRSQDREVQRVLSDGMSSLADELAKRWESMVAREQRYEARTTAQARELAEMRTAVATLQQVSHTLKREMERVLAAGVPPGAPAPLADESGAPTAPPSPAPVAAAGEQAIASDTLASYTYVGFEDHFRGSAEQIRANLADYLGCFEGASDVLDVGCGRGEFLQLLKERGIRARGVELNHEMAESCRSHGLDVAEGDALTYLRALPDASLGGLFASQVVEHLQPDYLLRLLDVAFSKLRPGARIVLETINPACWAAFFDSYIRDLTHVRPVHPDTLKYLLLASGFQSVDIRYRAPYPDEARLQAVATPTPALDAPSAEWVLRDLGDTLNANLEKLNARLFTYLDYAAVGTR